MSRYPVAIVITLLAVTMAGCGGGSSLGNAHPWCGVADDFIRATEKYSEANEDSKDAWREAEGRLDRVIFDTGIYELRRLYQYGDNLRRSGRSQEAIVLFEEAKDGVVAVCAS